MSAEPGGFPSISVVIPARNAESTLGAQLEALCGQEYEGAWDVVVVDNGSTDATVALARSFADRLPVRVLSATEGRSAAYARNVGVASSDGELLVFLDSDDVAAPGLLAAYAARKGDFDVMGGHLDEHALNDPVTASWRYPATDGALPVAFGRYPYFLGANCAVTRSAFEAVGPFDETLEFVGEEVDFSIRASLAGHSVGWVPEAVVNYRHRASLRALSRQYYVYGRGSVVLYQRYEQVALVRRRLMLSARRAASLVYRLPDLVRGPARRGRWIMLASAAGGQAIESLRRRTLYVT
jgi:glycosyltransferase involved in cell wall biosynthesis